MEDQKAKMAEKLWEMANLITGFAVVQSVGTAFALSKGDLRYSLTTTPGHIGVFVVTIGFAFAYTFAIRWCSQKGMELDGKNEDIWKAAAIGRITAVIVFTLITLVAVVGHMATKWPDKM
jgi:amino acid transporter